MNNKLLTLSLSIGAILLSTQFAHSQPANCGKRDAMVNRLTKTYGEVRQSMGLAANNSVLEVFASDETGTWTIIVTTSRGVTCLVASGQAFEELAESLTPASETDA